MYFLLKAWRFVGGHETCQIVCWICDRYSLLARSSCLTSYSLGSFRHTSWGPTSRWEESKLLKQFQYDFYLYCCSAAIWEAKSLSQPPLISPGSFLLGSNWIWWSQPCSWSPERIQNPESWFRRMWMLQTMNSLLGRLRKARLLWHRFLPRLRTGAPQERKLTASRKSGRTVIICALSAKVAFISFKLTPCLNISTSESCWEDNWTF